MHDPQISARVESQQTMQEGHTRNLTREAASQRKQASAKGSLQERIQAILRPFLPMIKISWERRWPASSSA